MFSAAAAFRASNPELGSAAWLGYPLALGVASGMWLGDHHYASDIFSGALFGQVPTPGNGFELGFAGVW
jgi:hypothetical protein